MSDHETVVDHLAHVLLGVAPDLLEDILHALEELHLDLASLTPDDVHTMVTHLLDVAVGAAAKEIVKQNGPALRAAITRALS